MQRVTFVWVHICAARFPSISEQTFSPMTTGQIACSQILLSRYEVP